MGGDKGISLDEIKNESVDLSSKEGSGSLKHAANHMGSTALTTHASSLENMAYKRIEILEQN